VLERIFGRRVFNLHSSQMLEIEAIGTIRPFPSDRLTIRRTRLGQK